MSKENKGSEVHHYDGIEEHDNPIPEWFAAFFYGGVLFGLLYYSYFELWGGRSLRQEYDQSVATHELLRLEREGNVPKASEAELLALSANSESRRTGSEVYSSKCASCHGVGGQGGIGPNLTDAYWIHGGKAAQIRDTIGVGVLAKGMPPWGGILSVAEVNSVSAYVHSLRGTRPPGAKAPQGSLEKE